MNRVGRLGVSETLIAACVVTGATKMLVVVQPVARSIGRPAAATA